MATCEINRTLLKYEVSQQQEAHLMIRYTKMFSRELLFAVDLMAFVMEESNLKFQNYIYPNCFGRRTPSDFDDVIKKFVAVAVPKTIEATWWSRRFSAMGTTINLADTNYAEFKCFANACAIEQEEGEFGDYKFLMFCVIMAKMCSVAFLHDMTNAPDFGIMLMCRTYRNFLIKSVLPANPWQEIKTSASETAEFLELLGLEARRLPDFCLALI